MGYAEKRTDKYGEYFRARYKKPDGKYGTVQDKSGATRRFAGKREAVKAANDEEAAIRAKKWKDPAAGLVTFGEFANQWYGSQDLAASTMANYKRRLQQHLLPAFLSTPLVDITPQVVDEWERTERAAGYAPDSIRSWRMLLHTILSDAVTAGHIDYNPVAKKRNRGKRAGRSQMRAPEKVIIDPLGALLVAERCALLTGRDDEFVMVSLLFWTGMRWGEVTGLETRYVRPSTVRVEWQLCEIDGGEIVRCPPKDDSYRDVDLPAFLSQMLAGHVARTDPRPCSCHGQTYVFRGQRPEKNAGRKAATLADVARAAGVSVGTVSNYLNRPERLSDEKRAAVAEAVAALGFTPGGGANRGGHWRRSGFAAWVFTPAVSGWFPPKGPQKSHPVALRALPFPGVPIRGRGAAERSQASWTPIAAGLTPHGCKHSHKSLMVALRTPEVLSHERLGHELAGIGGVYSHVTQEMRNELCEQLTARWLSALDARLAMSPRSPVGVLDALLRERARETKRGDDPLIVSPDSPQSAGSPGVSQVRGLASAL